MSEPLFCGSAVEVAADLLGRVLETEFDGIRTSVVIDEVEAYGGEDDPASHAYRGRRARNASMFARSGTLYVYRSYGIHWCANVVTGPEDVPSAVLIRGGIPIEGVDEMRRRRDRSDHLADGPGKLCEALGITGEHDGSRLDEGPVRISRQGRIVPAGVSTGPRIGIGAAEERPWRFLARFPDGSTLSTS